MNCSTIVCLPGCKLRFFETTKPMRNFAMTVAIIGGFCVATIASAQDIRKNIKSLTDNEKQNLVKAILKLKAVGRDGMPAGPTNLSVYDNFVLLHREEWTDAHRKSVFLPWHRQFLVEMQKAIRTLPQASGDPDFTKVIIPYWDWTDPNQRSQGGTAGAIVWTDSFMVKQGSTTGAYDVTTGPFNMTALH